MRFLARSHMWRHGIRCHDWLSGNSGAKQGSASQKWSHIKFQKTDCTTSKLIQLPYFRPALRGGVNCGGATVLSCIFFDPPVHLLIFVAAEISGCRTSGHTAPTRRFTVLGLFMVALPLGAAPTVRTAATTGSALSAAQRQYPTDGVTVCDSNQPPPTDTRDRKIQSLSLFAHLNILRCANSDNQVSYSVQCTIPRAEAIWRCKVRPLIKINSLHFHNQWPVHDSNIDAQNIFTQQTNKKQL